MHSTVFVNMIITTVCIWLTELQYVSHLSQAALPLFVSVLWFCTHRKGHTVKWMQNCTFDESCSMGGCGKVNNLFWGEASEMLLNVAI